LFDAVYHTGPPLEVKSPVLRSLVEQYISTLQGISLDGDDWGSLGGLERYNHCQYIWEDFFRSGDPRQGGMLSRCAASGEHAPRKDMPTRGWRRVTACHPAA